MKLIRAIDADKIKTGIAIDDKFYDTPPISLVS